MRAPWWWPDPWDVVPRVEDRISPYSGVPPQLPRWVPGQQADPVPKGMKAPTAKLDGGWGVP